MARFTVDNTEGYTAADLAILNERFALRVERAVELADSDIAPDPKSYEDHVAEQILALFDMQRVEG